MRFPIIVGLVAVALASTASVSAQDLWRNQYDSPYSDGGSWTDGDGDYNDTTNRYGSPMGGPTIYSEQENKTYQCTSSGTCYEAWDGF